VRKKLRLKEEEEDEIKRRKTAELNTKQAN